MRHVTFTPKCITILHTNILQLYFTDQMGQVMATIWPMTPLVTIILYESDDMNPKFDGCCDRTLLSISERRPVTARANN